MPAGQPLITVAGEASWPLTWYLRDTPTTWTSRIDRASTPVIVADWDPEGALEKQLAEKYDARRVPIRAWWFRERWNGTPEKPEDAPPGGTPGAGGSSTSSGARSARRTATFFVRKDLAGEGALAPLGARGPGHDRPRLPHRRRILPAERVFGSAGAGDGQLAEPRGLAVDGRGNLYVADTKNSRIQVFDSNGQFLRAFGHKGGGDGELNEPCGVAVDADGGVWVADTWNHRIVHFTADGRSCAPSGIPSAASSARARSSFRAARSTSPTRATSASSASTATGRRRVSSARTATGPVSSSSPSVWRRTRRDISSSPTRAITASRSSTRRGSSCASSRRRAGRTSTRSRISRSGRATP